MLRIGVEVPRHADESGEYLADARALEAAGVDSIWLDHGPGHDPWMLGSAIAAVTGRVRLAIPVAPAGARDPDDLAQRLSTLERLSRGRTMLRLAEGTDSSATIVELARRVGRFPLVVEAADEDGYRYAVGWADGVVHRGATRDAAPAALRRLGELRQGGARPGELELWASLSVPDSRDGWNAALQACTNAGATGAIVPFGPRLLDLLRRGDEEDDRSDLLVAQG